MSEVSFPGEPPFDLPTTQTASAYAEGDAVEVALRAIVPGHGPEPQVIRAAMTWKVAKGLADQLRDAALKAELRAAQKD